MKIEENILFANHYRLMKRLGRGAFGEVWQARDEKADINVAIKIYIGLDDQGIKEFKDEFRNVYNLSHTNLLRPDYYDVADCRPFLVMQLCEGSTVQQIGRMEELEVWRFICDVASGLAYLHENEIVHRDIKPDNILRNKKGNYVISDFGVSTRLRSTLRRNSTRKVDDISGTVAYMAPELFSDHSTAVKATDIWALGATLYELVSGEMPFMGQGGILQLKGAHTPFLPKDYSKDLNAVVGRCMSLNTWERPTAAELSAYAQSQLNGEQVVMPWKNRRKHTNSNRNNKYAIWIVAVVAVVLACAIGYTIGNLNDGGKETGTLLVDANETVGKTDGNKKEGEESLTPSIDEEDTAKKQAESEAAEHVRKAAEEKARQEKEQAGREAAEKALKETQAKTTGTINGHEYVDLGLSVKWATCNIGASSPSEYGNYYSWGETSTKSSYTKSSFYDTYNETTLDTIGNIAGDVNYDAARANWGSTWRMPTADEFDELEYYCTWNRITLDGNYGIKITGPNGNSIFLPASGYYNEGLINAGEEGTYWGANRSVHGKVEDIEGISAFGFYYHNDSTRLVAMAYALRFFGLSVRPVTE